MVLNNGNLNRKRENLNLLLITIISKIEIHPYNKPVKQLVSHRHNLIRIKIIKFI